MSQAVRQAGVSGSENRSLWWGLAIAQIVCAFLLALGFTSANGAWLGWLSLPTLLLAVKFLRPLQAMSCGAVWGASFFVFASGHGVVPATPAALALLVGAPAVYTLLGSCLTRSRAGFSPLLLAAAWIGVEYCIAPLGLRFGLLSGTLPGEGFLQVAGGILGYGFIAFVIAYANGLILWLLAEVCSSSFGPLFVPGVSDPGAYVIPKGIAYQSRRTSLAARPRAPPL